MELDSAPGDPVEDVVFEVRRVSHSGTPIDMRTIAGQQLAAQVLGSWDGVSLSAPFSVPSTGVEETTDEDGLAVFDNLELGLYLVEEVSAPAGVTPAGPFLVTLPLSQPGPHPETTSWTGDWWLYNVHVYPKNAVTPAPVKTVEDSEIHHRGQVTTWTITTTLQGAPHDLNGDSTITGDEVHSFTGFAVRDDLDSRLVYLADSLKLKVDGVDLVPADYTVTWDPAPDEEGVVPAGAVMLIQFTEQGLAKLNAAGDGGELAVSFDTVANASGVIPNTAQVYTNGYDTELGPDEQDVPPTVTPTVEQKFGGITLVKTASDTNAAQPGAKFQVWVDVNGNGKLDEGTDTAVDQDGTAGPDVWTTGNDGKVVIDGLRYSNWADGKAVTETDPEYNKYLLVEVDAPEGYSLLAAAVPFVVTTPASGEGATQVPVVNKPFNSGPELPLTGGAGLGLLIGTGAVLMGGGALLLGLHVARRRREQAAAAAALL
ncbi:SpaH/EbpB family LPXTG-anchored major pilin [Leucobacter massiliensis]|uniref:Gram-positive cocci surface proteins LPxTG domain-containing protein n=1 Tax=Leucobacter massiliensis TaxID=1686285 RepID=A0A2S9QPH3_9MICO|nr:SpaH/EbpB family LPXTG-anchored major pilin [Leucobacter massiliensis]PRI11490.1 hypothetical protein B4915_06580 [Leucobacter massiliensis]